MMKCGQQLVDVEPLKKRGNYLEANVSELRSFCEF